MNSNKAKQLQKILMAMIMGALMTGCTGRGNGKRMTIEQCDDTLVVNISNGAKYLLLPVQENQREAKVRLLNSSQTGNAGVWMDVRLAVDSVDYYVPFACYGENPRVQILGLNADALAIEKLSVAEEFSTENREFFRPEYHFTPAYGWMNDPNGLTYLDGEYHLFFQYNPYGSKWGNMHWGHSVSKDLVHWQQLDPAIERDNYGHIFSGSSYIARLPEGEKDPFKAEVLLPGNGQKGDFIAAYYTTHNDGNPKGLTEQQSFAVSTDGGRTFSKYGAPVLKSDGRRDFRDPKLFWNAQLNQWGMIVSADNEMQFYASKNLRDWSYISAFGDGYGVQPRQFECPDFFCLPVEGEDTEVWVMIVNVNPGCWFGGSATQYFTGTFDGTQFVCDSPKETVKWLDWGKDHYAAVTFSCEPKGRVIAMPWMSNWQYANDLPTQQYRSQMGMPRELFAFRSNGQIYIGQKPVSEMNGVSEPIELDIAQGQTIRLENSKGEYIELSCKDGRIYFERTHSGIIPSDKFADVPTWAPVEQICGKKASYHLQLWLDKCSVEMFIDGGKVSMTNLVFPQEQFHALK